MPTLFVPEESLGAAQLGDQPSAHGRHPDPLRARRCGLRLLGLLAGQHPGGRLRRLGCRRDRDEPGRLPVERAAHVRRPRVLRLPGRPRGQARPDARPLHQRCGHAPRRVPRAALGARSDDRQPQEAPVGLRHLRPLGLPRLASTSTRAPSRTPTCRLDQGIIMAAIGNALGGRHAARRVRDGRRRGLSLQPVIGQEQFGAGPVTDTAELGSCIDGDLGTHRLVRGDRRPGRARSTGTRRRRCRRRATCG